MAEAVLRVSLTTPSNGKYFFRAKKNTIKTKRIFLYMLRFFPLFSSISSLKNHCMHIYWNKLTLLGHKWLSNNGLNAKINGILHYTPCNVLWKTIVICMYSFSGCVYWILRYIPAVTPACKVNGIYSPFHNSLPSCSVHTCCISVENYEICCIICIYVKPFQDFARNIQTTWHTFRYLSGESGLLYRQAFYI